MSKGDTQGYINGNVVMCYDYYSNLTYYLLQIDLDGWDLNEWKKKKVSHKMKE